MAVRIVNVPIFIKEGTVLPRGKNHILLYSKDGDYYYGMEIKDVFSKYEEEFASMKESFGKTESEAESRYDEATRRNESMVEDEIRKLKDLEFEVTSKFNVMMNNYKELSERILNLVEAYKEVK